MVNEDQDNSIPAGVDQGHATPAIPVIAGFTPINGHFSSVAPEDSDAVPVTLSIDGKGKKRKTTKTPRPRQPKKAKQAVLPKEQPDTQASHPEVLEPSVPALASSGVLFPTPRSLQFGGMSPLTEGLISTYQAAFRQDHLSTVLEEYNGLTELSVLSDENDRSARRSPCPAPTADSTSNDTVATSMGLMPSYSGAMVSGQQYQLESNPDTKDTITPAINGFTQVVPTENPVTNANATDYDVLDLSLFDDFLTNSTGEDCSLMELSKIVGEGSETKCTTRSEITPQTLPEPVVGSDAFSYLSDADLVQSLYENQSVNTSNNQPFIKPSSPCLQSPSGHQLVSNQEASSGGFIPDNQSSTEDMYDDMEIETGFLDFQSPPSAQVPPPSPPESPDQKRITQPQRMPPNPVTPATSPVKPAIPSSSPEAVSTPASVKEAPTPPQTIRHKVSCDENGAAIPFIRPVFPESIRDRPHVLGLNSRTMLRTCFRIGEALNAGSTAVRTRKDAVIELYTRVTYSERPVGSVKQHFQFADIFSPDKPPFLKGTYGLWKGVGLWDQDSKVFLGWEGKGKMARVVGRIGREEKSRNLEMTVLSIWKANWEDVGICKGHYCE
ncbi:MAG: hypothetical protein Q9169_000702 [Polycauliona sp. 2 TL-2023]